MPAPSERDGLPELSVVMPVRNEAAQLERSVASVLTQTYPSPFEVVLAVARSTDGTEEIAARLADEHNRVKVVPNERGTTSAGLNAAIRASTGEIIARVDGHCELSAGYLHRAATTLVATDAQVVGGVQDARGEAPIQRAIAAAMSSRFGVGNARFHYGGVPGPADTVYLGVFRRDTLERAGCYDETLIRNQDYELNWRIRDAGGTVWFDPELRVEYRPRDSLRALAAQYFEYGQWKREVLRRHPRSTRLRQLAPPVVAALNASALALALVGRRRWLMVPVAYGAATAAASASARGIDIATRIRMPAALATMHHAWGIGFIVGTCAARGAR